MSALLSVLIPAYNAEKYIKTAITSILDQSYSDFEILIADDASTDGTRSIIESIKDSRMIKIHNEKNIGKTATVNRLYTYSTGQFITIHDADDISEPTRFQQQLMEFSKNSKLGMCGTSFVSISPDGRKILGKSHMAYSYDTIRRDIEFCSQFHGPTMMIRRSVLDDLGIIYRAYFKDYNEDTDLAYRIADRYECYNLPEVLYRYRILSSSLSKKPDNVRRRYLYKVVVHLAKQRAERGFDSLDVGNNAEIDALVSKLTSCYANDSSLLFRESAAYYMYLKYHLPALREAGIAVAKGPAKLINYRTLGYCLKTMMRRLFHS